MKIIKYPTSISTDLKKYFEFHKIYKNIDKILKEKYGANELIDEKLFEIYKIGNLEKKTILDLGCGSINSNDSFLSVRDFEPWLGRALHEMKINYIGIDKNETKEEFTTYKKDLSFPNSLDFIEDNSIDIICAYSFFDSPSLYNEQKTLDLLSGQIKRIAKTNGHFIIDLPQYLEMKLLTS